MCVNEIVSCLNLLAEVCPVLYYMCTLYSCGLDSDGLPVISCLVDVSSGSGRFVCEMSRI